MDRKGKRKVAPDVAKSPRRGAKRRRKALPAVHFYALESEQQQVLEVVRAMGDRPCTLSYECGWTQYSEQGVPPFIFLQLVFVSMLALLCFWLDCSWSFFFPPFERSKHSRPSPRSGL